jgi:hypothetical protein
VRRALLFAFCGSALVALVAVGLAAAAEHRSSGGQGDSIVTPASVPAGAKGKMLHFTFLATTDGAASGGIATFTFPRNWPAPHTNGSATGRVSVTPTGCSAASIAGVSGSVVTVRMTCKTTQTFSLAYGRVTVPAQPGEVTFRVQTADGTVGSHKHGIGPLHSIVTPPLLTVSGGAGGNPGGNTSGNTPARLSVSAPSSVGAGTSATFTVTAEDSGGQTATGYAGTVHFTSSDGAAVLPADARLTAGVGTFSATLKTAGTQTITATDTLDQPLTGTSASISVTPGPATHFTVTATPSSAAGSAFTFTVTALDQFGNTATGYGGTVHFTSSDGAAVLPGDSTLANGTRTFSATLTTTGSQTITATDAAASSLTGSSNTITVS